MKVLITGSNGQVGYALGREVTKTSWDIKLLTRQELDITSQDAIHQIVKEFCPTVIINAAAYTAVDKAENNESEAFAINADAVGYLAEAAEESGAVLIHISTDYVFSGEKNGPYNELDATSPQTVYGKSKLAGELAITAALEKYIILRTSWVFGEHGNNFVKTMVRLGQDRDQLSVVADQIGGPTYAGDIANAIMQICGVIESKKSINYGIYHYSGYPHVSWYDFASQIFNEAHSSQLYEKEKVSVKPISSQEYPTPAKRPINSRLDCAKIMVEFSIQPSDWMLALKNISEYA